MCSRQGSNSGQRCHGLVKKKKTITTTIRTRRAWKRIGGRRRRGSPTDLQSEGGEETHEVIQSADDKTPMDRRSNGAHYTRRPPAPTLTYGWKFTYWIGLEKFHCILHVPLFLPRPCNYYNCKAEMFTSPLLKTVKKTAHWQQFYDYFCVDQS